VPVAQAVNLNRQLKANQKAGIMVEGLAADGTMQLPDMVADAELVTGPLVVVVGSEGKGLGRLVAETCDQIVSIPISASTESLNAGIAASVTLYEISKLRTTE
jgi:23S rRNA (guanosine2251-2'-O)-methyltransferase